jgi:hypothetical protein
VVGHLLGNFELPAVLEIGSDAGRPEGMAANFRLDASSRSSPANHSPYIGLQHGAGGQLSATPLARAEEWPFTVLGDAGGRDVLLKVAVEIVVRRHLVLLATFFVKPDPAAPPSYKVILDPHGNYRPHAGEGVDHQADERPVAQAGKGSGVDCIEQGARLIRLEHWRLAAPLRMLWPPDGMRRIDGQDLADNHPIEEHPQCRQALLHRGFRMQPELHFDEGRNVYRLDLAEIRNAYLGAEGGKLSHSFKVGAAGVGIADMRTKEIAHPLASIRTNVDAGPYDRGCSRLAIRRGGTAPDAPIRRTRR